MTRAVSWLGTQGEGKPGSQITRVPESVEKAGRETVTGRCDGERWEGFAAHNFTKRTETKRGEELYDEADRDPDLWLYRKKTRALLRRYMQWSLEAGRVPSLLGRELFRSKLSAYSATTFESRVIFLHDVEGCLDRLGGYDRQIIAKVILQEYDHEAAARILRCDRKTIERRLPELIDDLTEALLQAGLLERLPETKDCCDAEAR